MIGTKCEIEDCLTERDDGFYPFCTMHLLLWARSPEHARAEYFNARSPNRVQMAPEAKTAQADYARRVAAEKRNSS